MPQNYLTVDIGNTSAKFGIFSDEKPVRSLVCSQAQAPEQIVSLLGENNFDGLIYCSTAKESPAVVGALRQSGVPVLALGPDTPLPLKISYSGATLGADRMATAVGAVLPGESALVVDAGTALTADVVAAGEFRGGNISPGLAMRFRALHDFTARLPLVGPEGDVPGFGYDTSTAIRAGVVWGCVAEIKHYYSKCIEIDKDIKLILTGGDAEFLSAFLREGGLNPAVDPEALGRGLVRIFKYNQDL